MIDYTEIRDDRIRGKICDLMSAMLDNPDEQGIFPTSRFMWEMETFILAEVESVKKLEAVADAVRCHAHYSRSGGGGDAERYWQKAITLAEALVQSCQAQPPSDTSQ